MKLQLLEILKCPKSGSTLELEVEEFDEERDEVKQGKLTSKETGKIYLIKNYIPRFVKGDGYTKSFSFQWKKYKKTQYSTKENDFTEKQLKILTGLGPKDVKGKLILDAGCGSGRFSDIFLKWGAEVVSIDLSLAIESAEELLGRNNKGHFIQASIYDLPFEGETFDFIWSYGVLMATPDTKKAFTSLSKLVKNGGKLGIWIYSNYNKLRSISSDILRGVSTRLPIKIIYYLSYLSIPLYYLYKIPVIGHLLRNIFVISMRKDWEWRVLETFDWYSPKYQWKHRYPEVFNWYAEEGFEVIYMSEPPVGMVGVKR